LFNTKTMFVIKVRNPQLRVESLLIRAGAFLDVQRDLAAYGFILPIVILFRQFQRSALAAGGGGVDNACLHCAAHLPLRAVQGGTRGSRTRSGSKPARPGGLGRGKMLANLARRRRRQSHTSGRSPREDGGQYPSDLRGRFVRQPARLLRHRLKKAPPPTHTPLILATPKN
jgi:hypothetical protein